MLKNIKRWIRKKRRLKSLRRRRSGRPRAWAVNTDSFGPHGGRWTKVVSPSKPNIRGPFFTAIGPFRSEVDCEEFCDHENQKLSGWIKYYTPQQNPTSKSKNV